MDPQRELGVRRNGVREFPPTPEGLMAGLSAMSHGDPKVTRRRLPDGREITCVAAQPRPIAPRRLREPSQRARPFAHRARTRGRASRPATNARTQGSRRGGASRASPDDPHESDDDPPSELTGRPKSRQSADDLGERCPSGGRR